METHTALAALEGKKITVWASTQTPFGVQGMVGGQGGDTGTKGLVVPVIVEGPWHAVTYRPDLAGMIGDIAKDPTKALEGAKDTVKKLKQGTGGIGDVLKGVANPPASEGQTGDQGAGSLIPDPKKALKGLLGN